MLIRSKAIASFISRHKGSVDPQEFGQLLARILYGGAAWLVFTIYARYVPNHYIYNDNVGNALAVYTYFSMALFCLATYNIFPSVFSHCHPLSYQITHQLSFKFEGMPYPL